MFPQTTQYTIADRIGFFYSEFFGLIYPYIHNHFVSYSLILLISLVSVWVPVNRFKRSRSTGSKLAYAVILLVVGSFSVWLILFHFQTVLQADLYYDDQTSAQGHLK